MAESGAVAEKRFGLNSWAPPAGIELSPHIGDVNSNRKRISYVKERLFSATYVDINFFNRTVVSDHQKTDVRRPGIALLPRMTDDDDDQSVPDEQQEDILTYDRGI